MQLLAVYRRRVIAAEGDRRTLRHADAARSSRLSKRVTTQGATPARRRRADEVALCTPRRAADVTNARWRDFTRLRIKLRVQRPVRVPPQALLLRCKALKATLQ